MLIDKIDSEVHRNESKVNKIYHQNIIDLAAQNLRGYTCDIACDYKQNKLQAHIFGCFCFNVFLNL